MKILSICIFWGLMLSASQLNGQPEIERQIQLIKIVEAADGYEITHNLKIEALRNGASDNYHLNLERGWSYRIYAVCDKDCSDLDLCLYDENGNEIGCDKKTDSLPVISASPRWSGRFRLWVKMYDCKINPCQFGVAIFGK